MERSRNGRFSGKSRCCLVLAYPLETLGFGVARRVDHILDYYEARGIEVHVRTVGGRSRFPVARYLSTAVNLCRILTEPREVHLHVMGLMQPRAGLYARLGWLAGHRTTVDVCDSVRLIAESATGAAELEALARRCELVLRRLPNGIGVSYITKRDSEADGNMHHGRSVTVIPVTAARDLGALPAVDLPRIERFVLSGDLSSFHVQEGLRLLDDAWARHLIAYPDSVLDVYGRTVSRVEGWRSVNLRGFAPSVLSLYEGATAVIIPNMLTSGVPNKLVEAVAARRPIVAHASLAYFVGPHPWLLTYRDLSSFVDALADARALDLQAPVPPMSLIEMA